MSEIDWGLAYTMSISGKLHIYLEKLPKCQWKECDKYNWSFLHYATFSINLLAAKMLLTIDDFDINVIQFETEWTALTYACARNNAPLTEIICTRRSARIKETLLKIIVGGWPSDSCVKMLIANGARLHYVPDKCRQTQITPEMIAFERGILNCRDVIIVFLGLKKRRQILCKLDRFLVSQVLAVEIWSTRSCESEKW